jgi:hypothetical protein
LFLSFWKGSAVLGWKLANYCGAKIDECDKKNRKYASEVWKCITRCELYCCNRCTKNDYVKGESCVNCVDFFVFDAEKLVTITKLKLLHIYLYFNSVSCCTTTTTMRKLLNWLDIFYLFAFGYVTNYVSAEIFRYPNLWYNRPSFWRVSTKKKDILPIHVVHFWNHFVILTWTLSETKWTVLIHWKKIDYPFSPFQSKFIP